MKENYITRTILEEAQTFADTLIKETRVKTADKLRAVKKQLETEEAAALEEAKKKAERAAEHQKTLNELGIRKADLIKKHETLDEVFRLAKAELVQGARTDAILTELVTNYARKGDTVIVSKKLPETLAGKFKLKQIVDKNIEGGIILCNETYELNLTFDELLKNFRARNESEIAKILFAEG